MGAYLTLGITKDLINIAMQEGPQYARLLAFNDRGRQGLELNMTFHSFKNGLKHLLSSIILENLCII